jgi:hypothetical protein
MTDYRNENIDPEDFWPEAEKLLDQHFKAKKRRRGLIILLITFLIGGSITSYLYNSKIVNTPVENSASKNDQFENLDLKSKQIENQSTTTENKIDQNKSFSTTDKKSISTTNLSQRNNNKTTNAITVINSDLFQNNSNHPTVNKMNVGISLNSNSDEVENNNLSSTNSIIKDHLLKGNSNYSISFTPSLNTTSVFENAFGDSISEKVSIESKKQKRRLELTIYGGGICIDNNLNSESNVTYIQRRNREEQPIIAPNFGASISSGKGKWDVRAGIELSMLGEKIKYTPFSDGDYYESYGDWQQTQYSYTDSDSTFIFGNLYINTTIVTVNDSSFIIVTDTVNGAHYDESVTYGNGTNKFYYLELPLEIAYTTYNQNWGFGISAGISPAFLIASDGYYLTSDQNGIKKISNRNHTQLHLNGRLNLELSYNINEKLRLIIRPNARMNLTNIKDFTETNHSYLGLGINAGAIFKIR